MTIRDKQALRDFKHTVDVLTASALAERDLFEARRIPMTARVAQHPYAAVAMAASLMAVVGGAVYVQRLVGEREALVARGAERMASIADLESKIRRRDVHVAQVEREARQRIEELAQQRKADRSAADSASAAREQAERAARAAKEQLAAAERIAGERAAQVARLEEEALTRNRTTARALVSPLSPRPAAAVFGRMAALAIGNGTYRAAANLSASKNDAADMASALGTLGFRVVLHHDLDRRGMEEAIRAFARGLDRADLALFFYSGHSAPANGKTYLLPIDAELKHSSALGSEAVDVGFVLEQIEARSRVNLLFVDSGSGHHGLPGLLPASSGRIGLAPVRSKAESMIAIASAPEGVAADGAGRNSPFSTALLKYLSTPGMDIRSIVNKVYDDMAETANLRQVPWIYSSLRRDVVLAPPR
ncbi:MAG: caspase family protein [Hyphomicrobiaceae bacterium]